MDKTLFDIYTDYLLVSFGQVSATVLSRLVDGAVSHDQITRMLASAPRHSPQLWQKVKPLVREVESADGVIVIDDSTSEKPYTDENELICWHWDHARNRTVKGINFLTALYQVAGVSLPVAFDLVTKTETYLDPKTGKEKRRSTLSKHDRMRTLLRACVHNEIPFGYVLADLWFASAENMKFIRLGLHKHFVFPVKENRTVAASAAAQKQGRYVAVDSFDLQAGQTRQIWLEGVPFPVLLTKEVFHNKDGSTGVRYLVTDDLTLTYDKIVKLYHESPNNMLLWNSPPLVPRPRNATISLPVSVLTLNSKVSKSRLASIIMPCAQSSIWRLSKPLIKNLSNLIPFLSVRNVS
jgi:hypothetical protein